MRRENRRTGALRILWLAMALGMLGCWAGELDQLYPRLSGPLFRFLIAAPFLSFLVFFGADRLLCRISPLQRTGREPSERGRLLLLLLLAILPRAIWWAAFPQEINSDYSLYLRMAGHYAETGTVLTGDYVLKIAPNAALFSVLLGGLMRVFGTGAEVAQGAGMALHAGNILLMYALGKRLTEARRAFAAAAIFAILPENVFYSTLPGNEALALTLCLLGLWMITKPRVGDGSGAQPGSLWAEALSGLAGGGLLAFSACIRPNVLAAVLAAGIWMIRKLAAALRGRFRASYFAMPLAFILGVAGIVIWNQAFLNRVFPEEKPVSGIGWPLYEGLDLESGGKWTEEKSRHCIEVIERCSAREADRLFLTEALERFRSYSPDEKIRMFLRKGGSLWYECRYSVLGLQGTEQYRTLIMIAGGAWFSA